MTGPTIPLSVTPTGITPSAGPAPSTALDTGDSDPFQAGADAVNGKNSNAFNVHRYPHDIATPGQPHYVIFYINLRKSTAASTELPSNISSVNFDQSSNNKLPSETGGVSPVVQIVGSAAAAQAVASAVGLSGFGAPFAFGAAVAGGVSSLNKDSTFNKLVQGDTTVLLKDVIALYLNGKPSVQYSASWADVDLGVANAIGDKFSKVRDDLKGGWDDLSRKDLATVLKDTGSKLYNDIFSDSGALTASLILRSADKANGALGNFGAAIQADAAIVPNPFKAQLFHTMGFRTFIFDYTFLPKNAQEYKEVQSIIKTFKKYMHPVVGGDKFIMKYPAEFSIAYYYKGQTNNELFKMTNCALTSCKVEYGGTDFTTFKRIPGGPTEISMQIAFVETELLTRDHIEAGY